MPDFFNVITFRQAHANDISTRRSFALRHFRHVRAMSILFSSFFPCQRLEVYQRNLYSRCRAPQPRGGFEITGEKARVKVQIYIVSFGSTENQTDSILFYFLILGKFKRLEKIRRPTRFIGLVKFLGLLFYSAVKLNSDGIRSSIIISRLTRQKERERERDLRGVVKLTSKSTRSFLREKNTTRMHSQWMHSNSQRNILQLVTGSLREMRRIYLTIIILSRRLFFVILLMQIKRGVHIGNWISFLVINPGRKVAQENRFYLFQRSAFGEKTLSVSENTSETEGLYFHSYFASLMRSHWDFRLRVFTLLFGKAKHLIEFCER